MGSLSRVSLDDILRIGVQEKGDKLKTEVFIIKNGLLEKAPFDSGVGLVEFSKKNEGSAFYIPAGDEAFLNNEAHFASKLKTLSKLEPSQKVEALQDTKSDLVKKLHADNVSPAEKMDGIRQASVDTFFLSKSSLDEFFKLDNIAELAPTIKESAKQTRDVVDTISTHISSTMQTQKVLQQLDNYRDGSTVGHINRVFVQTVKFLLFLQHNVENGLNDKIRSLFAPDQKYGTFYQRSFSQVFVEPFYVMTPAEITTYGLSALLHDVGKIPNISYFESDASYNRAAIEEHVFVGYDTLHKAAEFPKEVAYIAGSHHEYGGHPSGYGIRRSRIQNDMVVPAVVTNKIDKIYSGQARDFLVSECVALVDVHDALRCSRRKYREKPFTLKEALDMMKTMAIQDKKFNWVLFDLFVNFLASDISSDTLKQEFKLPQS